MKNMKITEDFIIEIEARTNNNPIEALKFLDEKFGLEYSEILSLKNPHLNLVYIITYYRNDRLEESIKLISNAFENLNSQQDNNILVVRLHSLLGNIELEDGDSLKALTQFKKALIILNHHPNLKQEGRILHNIGMVFLQIRDVDKAEQFFDIALKKSLSTNDDILVASIYQNLGNCKFHQDKLKEGEAFFDKAFTILNKIDYEYLKLSFLINLGRIKFFCKKEKIAIDYILNAYNISLKIKNYKFQAWSLIYLSELFITKKDVTNLKFYVDKLINILEKIQTKPIVMKGYNLKSRYEKINGNFEIALEYYEKYHDVRIQIHNDKIIKIQKEQESEIEKLNISIQLSDVRKDNKSLETELNKKNKELTAHLLKTVNFNTNLNEIKSELVLLRKKDNAVNNFAFNTIETKLKRASSLSSNLNWNEFENKFKEIYTDFFHSLSSRYPTLTNTEKKLCALLKLQLNSKEIAETLSVSVASIEVYRSRLRKKLGITFNENIHSFLDLIK